MVGTRGGTVGRSRAAAVVVAAGLLAAGCGGAHKGTATSSLGGPGDPAKATRTVEVRAGDDLRFDPGQVEAKAGETITFKVVNVAKIDHDFTLGDQKAQDDHEKEMRSAPAGGGMDMAHDANAVKVAAGETKELTWTFARAGTTIYGCHEPGHYASGMKGTVTVS